MEKLKLFERLREPTPTFFTRIKRIGLVLTAIGTGVLVAPVAVPAAIATAATCLIIAGSVAASVSQLTTADKGEEIFKVYKNGTDSTQTTKKFNRN